MQLELFANIVAQTPLWYANIENLARDTLVHEFQAGVDVFVQALASFG